MDGETEVPVLWVRWTCDEVGSEAPPWQQLAELPHDVVCNLLAGVVLSIGGQFIGVHGGLVLQVEIAPNGEFDPYEV